MKMSLALAAASVSFHSGRSIGVFSATEVLHLWKCFMTSRWKNVKSLTGLQVTSFDPKTSPSLTGGPTDLLHVYKKKGMTQGL